MIIYAKLVHILSNGVMNQQQSYLQTKPPNIAERLKQFNVGINVKADHGQYLVPECKG